MLAAYGPQRLALHTRALVTLIFFIAWLDSGVAQVVQVTLVDTFFTVTDKQGHFVKDLTKDDFTIFDNGIPQQVAAFAETVDSPLSIAFIIDRSQSVADRFPLEQKVAVELLNAVMRKGKDRGCVIAFDAKVYLIQDWTDETDQLRRAINQLTVAGGTSLFDAVYKACREKFNREDERKKVLILFTDGEDTTSRATLKQALGMAKLAGVTIYVIGVKASDSLNVRELQGKNVLTPLAEMTRGRAVYLQRPEDLAAQFPQPEEELRNQYNISYYLRAPLDGTFHKIRIEPRNKQLMVKTHEGYYAIDSAEELSR